MTRARSPGSRWARGPTSAIEAPSWAAASRTAQPLSALTKRTRRTATSASKHESISLKLRAATAVPRCTLGPAGSAATAAAEAARLSLVALARSRSAGFDRATSLPISRFARISALSRARTAFESDARWSASVPTELEELFLPGQATAVVAAQRRHLAQRHRQIAGDGRL